MWAQPGPAATPVSATNSVCKLSDVVIYEDAKFYAAFPSIVRRPDGELLVAFRRAPDRRKLGEPGITHTDPNSYLVLVRSRDGGKTWSREPQLIFAHPFGGSQDPCMVQLRDGTILCSSYAWARSEPDAIARLKQPAARAGDFVFLGGFVFNETSLYETPKGDLVAFLRTEGFNDHTVIARSGDHGQSFQWRDAGFQGHPHHAIRLPDQRVLLVYGYRHPPFGVRARVLDPECANIGAAEEIVLREDGDNGDLGYPWATMASKNRALVVYYFNRADGTRHIAGTFLQIQ